MRLCGALLLVFLSSGLSGCWSFKKKAPKPLPPLVQPKIEMQAPPAPMDLPPEATTPIGVEPPPTPPEVQIIKPELQPPPPAPQKKKQPKPAARKPASPVPVPPPPAPPPEAPTEGATAPQPAPQLGELISGERRVELSKELEQSLGRAQRTLNLASGRALTRRQAETANRIRTFIRQAEEAKARDISTALQLARRADLLAQDLASALQ